MIIHNIILHATKYLLLFQTVPIDKTPKYSDLTTKRTFRGEVGFICERGKDSQLLSLSVHQKSLVVQQ